MPHSLSANDSSVLVSLFDPEAPISATSFNLTTDPSLPPDPHIPPALYRTLQAHELSIISDIPTSLSSSETRLRGALTAFTALITSHPRYASAYNNRAQLTRLQFTSDFTLLLTDDSSAAARALTDLHTAISLLTPDAETQAVARAHRSTLVQALMQRAALWRAGAKAVAAGGTLRVRGMEGLSAAELDGLASADYAAAGRLGCEAGKVLGVAVNPTARLCGEIVRGALKREVEDGVVE